MIQDEKLGLKIAENSEEAFWTTTKEQCEKSIEEQEHHIKIQKTIIALCNEELKKLAI